MPNTSPPSAPPENDERKAPPNVKAKVQPRKALEEQQKRELPSNDWPGKGAA